MDLLLNENIDKYKIAAAVAKFNNCAVGLSFAKHKILGDASGYIKYYMMWLTSTYNWLCSSDLGSTWAQLY